MRAPGVERIGNGAMALVTPLEWLWYLVMTFLGGIPIAILLVVSIAATPAVRMILARAANASITPDDDAK